MISQGIEGAVARSARTFICPYNYYVSLVLPKCAGRQEGTTHTKSPERNELGAGELAPKKKAMRKPIYRWD
jgi:hypothetical protein